MDLKDDCWLEKHIKPLGKTSQFNGRENSDPLKTTLGRNGKKKRRKAVSAMHCPTTWRP